MFMIDAARLGEIHHSRAIHPLLLLYGVASAAQAYFLQQLAVGQRQALRAVLGVQVVGIVFVNYGRILQGGSACACAHVYVARAISTCWPRVRRVVRLIWHVLRLHADANGIACVVDMDASYILNILPVYAMGRGLLIVRWRREALRRPPSHPMSIGVAHDACRCRS